jgi:hypothetical protein
MRNQAEPLANLALVHFKFTISDTLPAWWRGALFGYWNIEDSAGFFLVSSLQFLISVPWHHHSCLSFYSLKHYPKIWH